MKEKGYTPDEMDTILNKILYIGIAPEKPQQLVDNTLQKDLLGG
jgi:hypothetical protein